MKSDVGRPAWAEDPQPDPLPLARELDPATPFPVEALGAVGAAVVEQMHAVIQAPEALIVHRSAVGRHAADTDG